jgi:rhodanese-related sulfurtransferase
MNKIHPIAVMLAVALHFHCASSLCYAQTFVHLKGSSEALGSKEDSSAFDFEFILARNENYAITAFSSVDRYGDDRNIEGAYISYVDEKAKVSISLRGLNIPKEQKTGVGLFDLLSKKSNLHAVLELKHEVPADSRYDLAELTTQVGFKRDISLGYQLTLPMYDIVWADIPDLLQAAFRDGSVTRQTRKGVYTLKSDDRKGINRAEFKTLPSVKFQTEFEVNFQPPYNEKLTKWNADIVYTNYYNGKNVQKIRLDVLKKSSSNRDVQDFKNRVIALLPDNHPIVSDNAIKLVWDGEKVVKGVDVDGVLVAEQAQFDNRPLYLLIAPIAMIFFVFCWWLFTLRRKKTALMVTFTLLFTGNARAGDESSGPYCGIYCVHAGARAMGKQGDFRDLLTTEYVSSFKGSTATDLDKAAGRYGLKTKAYQHMTLTQLRTLTSPAILHMRSPGSARRFSHWVLFLGFDDQGLAKMYDPPRHHEQLAIPELLSLWDGAAVVLLPDDGTPLLQPISLEWIALVALLCTILFGLKRYSKPILLVPAAGLLGVLFMHAALPGGFFRSQDAIHNVAAAHFEYEATVVTKAEVYDIIKNGNGVLVDARPASMYEEDHIQGSVNVPVNLGYFGLKSALKQLSRDQTLIFYCNNEKCGWADVTASHFIARQYPRVVIYRGGMRDWYKP